MALSMFKNASNQKTDATLKDQLFKIYNFVYIECATFHIETEPCLTETKCNFRTFGVDETFWVKQKSCTSQKVGLSKWRLFLDSMHF